MNSLPSPVSETRPGTGLAPASRAGFRLLAAPGETAQDARHDEALLDHVAQYGPLACVWETRQSLVVPRSYRRHEDFDAVCDRFARQGWPVTVRQTGGGIVPQGPGIVNLSLAYAVAGPPMQHSEPGYELICDVLARALRALGIESFAAAVHGSFCDGRYNLAVLQGGQPVKIAGTAQSWRRVPGSADQHLGLVHALLLLDVDTQAVTAHANAFETALGTEHRYDAGKVVSAAALLGHPPGLQERFRRELERALAEAAPPGQRS